MAKKILVYVLSAMLVYGPIRSANAFVPAVVLLPAAGAAISYSVTQIAAAVAAGVAIAAILVSDAATGDSAKIHVNDKSPQTVPGGWTAGATPGAQPVPPPTTTPTFYYYVQGVGPQGAASTASTRAAACSAVYAPGTVRYHSPSDTYYCTYTAGGAEAIVAGGSTCPTGYTIGGGGTTCTLSNAAVVAKPADGISEKKAGSGSITNIPNDPDSATRAQPTVNTSAKVTYGERNHTVTIEALPSGGTRVTQTNGNGNGTSTRTVVDLSPPTAGTSGTDTVASSVKTETVPTEGGSSETDTASGTFTCTNCATEVTQLQIKDKLTTGIAVDEKSSTWTTQPSAVASSQTTAQAVITARAAAAAAAAASGNAGDLALGVPSLTLPSTAPSSSGFWSSIMPAPASCAAITTSATGRFSGMSFDICPVINHLKPIIEWGLYGLTALSLYGVFFTRKVVPL